MRALLAASVMLIASATPAPASWDHGITCRVADENLELDLFFGTGYGGYGFDNGPSGAKKRGGTLEVRARGVPPALRNVKLNPDHLKQSWLHGADFKLQLDWDAGGEDASNRANLVIEAPRSGGDIYGGSYVHGGSYILTLEGEQTLTFRGRVMCAYWSGGR